jgi:hypothetical protein
MRYGGSGTPEPPRDPVEVDRLEPSRPAALIARHRTRMHGQFSLHGRRSAQPLHHRYQGRPGRPKPRLPVAIRLLAALDHRSGRPGRRPRLPDQHRWQLLDRHLREPAGHPGQRHRPVRADTHRRLRHRGLHLAGQRHDLAEAGHQPPPCRRQPDPRRPQRDPRRRHPRSRRLDHPLVCGLTAAHGRRCGNDAFAGLPHRSRRAGHEWRSRVMRGRPGLIVSSTRSVGSAASRRRQSPVVPLACASRLRTRETRPLSSSRAVCGF